MFDRLIHADWGTNPKKRWMAVANRAAEGWKVEAPRQVPPACEFLNDWLLDGIAVLAGFDFPIGVPVEFGRQTSFKGFLDALTKFGEDEWKEFFTVAERPEEISLHRPFYPAKSKQGSKRIDLRRALRVATDDQLRRMCERKTETRGAACPLFWTLGGNQVGKAAISGWQEVVRPALARGARLWPFQDRLDELSKLSDCVLCETYPREAYLHIGVAGRGKRRQEVRQRAAKPVRCWAARNGVRLSENLQKQLLDGFGPSKSGEDPFDALVGLASMIDVVEGRLHEGSAGEEDQTVWEGWILGQQAV